MRSLSLLVALVAVAHLAVAQDFGDSPKKKRTSLGGGTERAAPTGFLAVPDDEDTDVSEEAPPEEEPPVPKKKQKRKDEEDASDTPAWNEAPRGRGLVVIDDAPSVSHVIRAGEEDPDRVGRPLGQRSSGGIGLVPKRATGTFKANAAVDEPDEETSEDEDDPRARKPARKASASGSPAAKVPSRPAGRTAPVGFMMPIGDDEDEDEAPATVARKRKDDPFGDNDAPTPAPNVRKAAPVDEEEDTPSTSWSSPSSSIGGGGSRRTSTGPGVPVEEVKIAPVEKDLFIPRSGKAEAPERIIAPSGSTEASQDTFLVAPSSKPVKAPKPVVERRPPPEPAVERDEPRTRRLLVEEPPAVAPVRAPLPAPAPEPTVEEPVVDPIAKMDAELRALEGKPPVDVLKSPEIKLPDPTEEPERRAVPPPVRQEIPPEPELATRPIEVSHSDPEQTRDPSLVGLSFLGAGGAAFLRDARTGWTPALAFGGSVEFWPSFAPSIYLDATFMHAAQSISTNKLSVDTSWNHVLVRVMFTRIVGEAAYLAAGAGPLLTQTAVRYAVNDLVPQTADAGLPRFGVDASFALGFLVGPLLVRFDGHVLVRGGMRLDFLPTLGVGIAL